MPRTSSAGSSTPRSRRAPSPSLDATLRKRCSYRSTSSTRWFRPESARSKRSPPSSTSSSPVCRRPGPARVWPPPSTPCPPGSERQRSRRRRSVADRPTRIYVLAGANGAGKSSIVGAMLRDAGADYFNPDEAARRIRAADPRLTAAEANSTAWHEGKRLLERAIAGRLDFAFESTLGAATIPALLAKAASLGIEVRVWYLGLSSPELHVARVRTRVAKGGHD